MSKTVLLIRVAFSKLQLSVTSYSFSGVAVELIGAEEVGDVVTGEEVVVTGWRVVGVEVVGTSLVRRVVGGEVVVNGAVGLFAMWVFSGVSQIKQNLSLI